MLDEIQNPFATYKEETGIERAPKFARTKMAAIRISEEANIQLHVLAHNLIGKGSRISDLMEYIGLSALIVSKPQNIVDEESGVSTDQCRQSGYEDGFLGDPTRFVAMFGKQLNDDFQQAYMRGFFEGNFVRNSMKKEKR